MVVHTILNSSHGFHAHKVWVLNAYVIVPCNEDIWTILGAKFGAHQGNKAIIVYALYGLKSSGAAFHSHLPDCI